MSSTFSKPVYIYKRFRVKRADGGSTTVSIDPALVVEACRKLGSLQTVSKIVREASIAFDNAQNQAKNRSAHVALAIKTILEAPKAVETQSIAAPVVSEAAVA